MKNVFYYVVFCLAISTIVSGQKGGPYFEEFCNCLSFVESCSGNLIKSLPGVKVKISCSDYPSEEYEIVDGRVCFDNKCTNGLVCVNGGNWEICKVVGCTVYLTQSIPVDITVNGTQLGYGPLSPGYNGGLTWCGRRVHTGALNTVYGATDILACPGDPIDLNISGMSLLRGMCLTITIRDIINNAVVASETYHAPGTPLSITNLISQLGVGTYKMEMQIHCCEGPTTCTNLGSYKYAYINIQGQFAYDAYAISGFDPNTSNFLPATSPPSSLLTGGTTLGNLKINQLTLIGYNVQNSSNTALNWKLNQVDCTTHNNPQQVSAGSLTPANNFNIGPILITTASSCQCYRLDLTYDDGCGDGLITDFYYFKEGTNCPPDALQDGDGTQNRNAGNVAGGSMCKVSPNPVNDYLNIDMNGKWLGQNVDIQIFDSQGRTIKSLQLKGQSKLQIDFEAVSGIYYYVIKGLEAEVTGKFIKI